ncbi:MAG: ASCH domain-containing protein [Lachnospiraceae bacterium]|nr:ASCH domain-containing protein [Lachnospiraceae bacterium]
MDKAFIVKEHWGNLILDGEKPWEIRGTSTQIRGRVGVVFSGTGMIQGSVEVVGSSLLLKEDFELFRKYHHVPGNFEELPYEKPHIWYLKDAIRFVKPVPYQHPRGAVIWVNIGDKT